MFFFTVRFGLCHHPPNGEILKYSTEKWNSHLSLFYFIILLYLIYSSASIMEYLFPFDFPPFLVGGFNHLEKWWSSSMGRIIPYIMENKKQMKPPTSFRMLLRRPTNRWGHQSLAPKLRLPSELSGDNVRAQVNSESERRPGGSHAPGMLGEWETIWETIG